uniref:Uncharacterized protein n=1 Tax=Anguilla anguilla TaxID=7936 RepID=A0A0E9Q9K7_ANGAN
MSSATLLREIAVWRRLLRVSLKTFSLTHFPAPLIAIQRKLSERIIQIL